MSGPLSRIKFGDISIDDVFFDDLKESYSEFPEWFARKSEEYAYLYKIEDGPIQGFLYLKTEQGPISDTDPPLPAGLWVKIGTLKIVAHGTKLGERFMKRVFDFAIQSSADGIYVTVFARHTGLIRILKRYGFVEFSKKETVNGIEEVLVRDLRNFTGDIRKDYPFVHVGGHSKFLLAIYPEYHTRLLPDSMLSNETDDVVDDISHTNTIHKVYVCSMNVGQVRPGDILIMYRTKDGAGPAWYRSVSTSVCVVEEVRYRSSFASLQEFQRYCRPHSVFSQGELAEMWAERKRLYAIKMTYNAAFPKRTTRGRMIEQAGISDGPRWDILKLTDDQFERLLRLGNVNESLIVD